MKLAVHVTTLDNAKMNDNEYMIEKLGNSLSFENSKMKYESSGNATIEYFLNKLFYQFTILTSTRNIVDNSYLKFLSIFQIKVILFEF